MLRSISPGAGVTSSTPIEEQPVDLHLAGLESPQQRGGQTAVRFAILRPHSEASQEGREKSYVLPQLPIRVVSLVPTITTDIRDAARDTFARTLDEDTAEEYEAEYNSAVVKRLPRFGLEIENR